MRRNAALNPGWGLSNGKTYGVNFKKVEFTGKKEGWEKVKFSPPWGLVEHIRYIYNSRNINLLRFGIPDSLGSLSKK